MTKTQVTPSTTASSEDVAPFTAEWCYVTALEIAQEMMQRNPALIKCPSCERGVTSLNAQCTECTGDGTMTFRQVQRYIVSNTIWCHCRESLTSLQGEVETLDGQEIFGNETFLCPHCSMVSQFG